MVPFCNPLGEEETKEDDSLREGKNRKTRSSLEDGTLSVVPLGISLLLISLKNSYQHN